MGTLATEMSRMVHGIHGLKSRLLEIQQYLQYVMEGKLPVNHDIMYQLQVKDGPACQQAHLQHLPCRQPGCGSCRCRPLVVQLSGHWQLLPHDWLVHTAALAACICSWHKLKLRTSCPELAFGGIRAANFGCASQELTYCPFLACPSLTSCPERILKGMPAGLSAACCRMSATCCPT